MLCDAVTGHLHVVQVGHDVTNISDLQPSEGILPGPVTPRPDHHGLRPDLPGPEPGPGPVGGGRVHRDPHHAGVQLGRLLQAGDGEPHEGGDTSRPGQVVLVGRQVEISGVKQSAKSGVFTLYLETAEDEKLLRDAFAASQNTLEK